MSWRMTEPPVFIHIDTHASARTPCEQDEGWLDEDRRKAERETSSSAWISSSQFSAG